MPTDEPTIDALSRPARRLLPYAFLAAAGTVGIVTGVADVWEYRTVYVDSVVDYAIPLAWLTLGWLSAFVGLAGAVATSGGRSSRAGE